MPFRLRGDRSGMLRETREAKFQMGRASHETLKVKTVT